MKNVRIPAILAVCILVRCASPTPCLADFFTLPGNFLYALNSMNDVMDVTADGTIGVVLTFVSSPDVGGQLTSFDPVTGQVFDSQFVSFGPAGVRIANTPDGPRVVVLTTEGGPNTVTIYDLSSSGALSQRARTRLTDSIIDFRSNLIVSSASVGFILVCISDQDFQILSFSLDDGSILGRLAVRSPLPSLGVKEVEGSHTLVYVTFSQQSAVVAIDGSDPTQMQELGTVQLTRNQQFSASTYVDFAFSSDGRYVFVANQFFDFAAVDLSNMELIASLDSGFRFLRVKLVEQNSQRLLALLSGPTGTGGNSVLLLLDASDPVNLQILNTLDVTNDFPSYLTFSMAGDKILAASDLKLKSLDVPTLTTVWELPIPNPSEGHPHQILTFGQPEMVLAAWGIVTSTLGSFLISGP
jgi:hypothetical protein